MSTTVRIDANRCQGCGTCVDVCPEGAISLEGERAVIDPKLCTGCQLCIPECPPAAIYIVIDAEERGTAGVILPQQALARGEIITSLAPREPGLLARMLRSPAVTGIAAFVGREIVPRAVDALLGGRDRRQSQAGDGGSRASVARPRSGKGGTGGVRARRRGGGGGRGGRGRR